MTLKALLLDSWALGTAGPGDVLGTVLSLCPLHSVALGLPLAQAPQG